MVTAFQCVCSIVVTLISFAVPAGAVEPQAPFTPEKFALILGNGNYVSVKASLKNPVNDAKLMGTSLEKLGFKVSQHFDLDKAKMRAAVSEFASSLPNGSTAVVFFAGHGMQIAGASYLLPIDMEVTSERSVPVKSYPLKDLLEQVSMSKSSVNVVILDACRDNPFQPAPAVRYRGFKDLGLGPVVAPRGTFVAYSTSPGQLAADGNEANSVYTATLARTILEPKMTLEKIFRKVGDQVRKKTLDVQIPWFESSLTDDYYFLPPEGIVVTGGVPLSATVTSKNDKSTSRKLDPSTNRSDEPQWYRSMSDYEWSRLDFDIQQRVKYMTSDEVPMLEHRAKGGSVVAQTTLGLYWLEGASRITESGTGKVQRYQANNSKALVWLRMAAKAEFPIAQTELGEMLHRGKGVNRDSKEARRLLASASQANYPRAKLDLWQVDMEEGNAGWDRLPAVIESMTKGVTPPQKSQSQ
jgi:hypothetical protein